MAEKDLARAIIQSAVEVRDVEFLTASGEHKEIAEFWFEVAEIPVLSSRQVDKLLLKNKNSNLVHHSQKAFLKRLKNL